MGVYITTNCLHTCNCRDRSDRVVPFRWNNFSSQEELVLVHCGIIVCFVKKADLILQQALVVHTSMATVMLTSGLE